MRWISALELERWAQTKNSEVDLPGLVSDLIRASVNDISDIRFPSGDKGQVRGFDGVLVCQTGKGFVPKGKSIWEFGTNQDYKTKASGDFKKRSGEVPPDVQRETTYVFVSPWTWDSSKKDNKLEDFVDAQKAAHDWSDVIYIDGSKLQTWFESCPAVAAWHARNTMQLAPKVGVRCIDEFWEDFVGRYDPKLVESVLLAGRKANAESLVEQLMGRPGPIRLSADSVDEVVAFAIAAIRAAKPEVRLFLESRAIVVETFAAGRDLIAKDNLIFLLNGETTKSPGQFYSVAPTLIPLGRRQKSGQSETLNRPTGYDLGKALEELGMAEPEARTLARGCGRSLSALQRVRPSGSYNEPDWFSDAEIFPAILAGAWDGSNDADIEIIRKLTGNADYDKLTERLRTMSREDDPPFVLTGGVWTVNAPIDAFIHTAGKMAPKSFELLEASLVSAFSSVKQKSQEEDPIFGNTAKYQSPHSDWLREGLSNTLLMISVLGKQAGVEIGVDNGKAFVDGIVSRLPGLNGNFELLACMRDELPLLAEASPGPFLQALEQLLEGDADSLRTLLTEDEGVFSPTAYHTGLLWALEALVWGQETFARSILILARLVEIDPGGGLVNRPINSLKEIFLPWFPNTCATVEQRNSMLTYLAKKTPDVAWSLLIDLLPDRITSSSGTQRPQLRDAAENGRDRLTQKEYLDAVLKVIELVIELAGHEPSRWIEIMRDITAFPEKEMTHAVACLRSTFEALSEADRFPVWAALRDRINDHRRFPDAPWTLSEEKLAPFDALIKGFEPESPVSSIIWMFDSWDFPTEDDKSIENVRTEAVKELLDKSGVDALVELGHTAKQPYHVVEAIEQSKLDFSLLIKVLEKSIGNPNAMQFSVGISGLLRSVGGAAKSETWYESFNERLELDDLTAAKLLLSWPMTTATWFLAKRLGTAVFDRYWSYCNGYSLRGKGRSFLRGLLNLLNARRGSAFLEATNKNLGDVPTRLILRALEVLNAELRDDNTSADTMVSYYLEKVFVELDLREDIEPQAIVGQELAFFPLLDKKKRKLVLFDTMATDPELFNQAIQLVFKSSKETENAQSTTDGKSPGRLAYSVLSGFRKLPGHTEQDVDAEKLSLWVDAARRLGEESGHSAITDIYVGHLFAHAPVDEDGGWPHRVVRDEIERIGSDDLQRGIYTERRNMRGVTTRGVYDGGDQERELSAKYEFWQSKASLWPRTSALLGALAESWKRDAEDHDVDAEQRKLKS